MKNKILSFLAVLVLLSVMPVSASANHPVPDLSQNGSLTFLMELEDMPLGGGALNLYKVGEIAEEDGNYFFQLFDGRSIWLAEEIDQTLADEMLALAKTERLTKLTAIIAEGKATFPDLPVGLYLVWQDDDDATLGVSPIRCFLISVPRFQDGAYELDVLAKPKNAPEKLPPEPPITPPPPGESPQTGQLKWPVPVLALGGAMLFLFGWALHLRGKRNGHEK